MRPLVLAIFLLASGCTTFSPAAVHSPGSTTDAVSSAPTNATFHGTLWVPTSTGSDAARTTLPLGTFGSNATLHATFHLGDRMPVGEIPVASASATIALVGPANDTLGHAKLMATGPDARLDATALAPGAYRLDVDMRGGSDGASMGDYVAYAVEASWGSR